MSTKKIVINADRFLGLSKHKAQDTAEGLNIIFRLIKVDAEEFLPYPVDVRDDRICVEIKDSKIVKATVQ
jgi:hypothetical protein